MNIPTHSPLRARLAAAGSSLAALILLLGSHGAALQAADSYPPARLSYQGYLVDGNGAPLGSTSVKNYDVIFRVYKVSQGGTPVWSEQQTVTVSQGNFSVLLGEGSVVSGEPQPAIDTVFKGADASERYVGITVKGLGGGNTEIAPRLRLLSNPYAFLSKYASEIVDVTGSSLFNFGNGGIQPSSGSTRGTAAIDLQVTRVDASQVAAGNYSVVAGGQNNRAANVNSTIGGGSGNTTTGDNASIGGGLLNSSGGWASAVAGGHLNKATGGDAAIGGGYLNLASGDFSTVAGGNQNTNTGAGGVIAGGTLNFLNGGNCVIGGGLYNTNKGLTTTIGGGYMNYASGRDATIGGGNLNTNTAFVSTIGGGLRNQTLADHSTIAGGQLNKVTGINSTIGGGAINTATAMFDTVGGGINNTIGSDYATISGGADNTNYAVVGSIGGGANNLVQADATTIGGGRQNMATSQSSTVGGGFANRALGTDSVVAGGYTNTASGLRSVVSGGVANTASGVDAVVAGGDHNTASGTDSFVAGGYLNSAAGIQSFAGGRRAKSNADGCFTWADRVDIDFAPNYANSFNVRASGGIHFYSNGTGWLDGARTGVFLAPGANSWANVSDRNAKKNFTPVDYKDVLQKLDQVPVTAWHYKSEADDSTKNIGPMAQDFKGTFYPGRDDKSITTLELDGVELAAIKGLREVVREQQAEIDTLKRQLGELKLLVEKKISDKSVAAK